MNKCHICNKSIVFGGRIYCSTECRNIAKKAKQRVYSQKKVLARAKEGQECKRCHLTVFETNMKKYCNSCTEILQVNSYSTYVAKPKKFYKCKTCDNPRDRQKTYCVTCKEGRKIAAIKKQTAGRASDRKIIKTVSTLPAWMLERGPVSSNSQRSQFG